MIKLNNLAKKYKIKAVGVPTIIDRKAAWNCIRYILDHEEEDYVEQTHGEVTKENWEKTWDKTNHIYVSALKAIGETPDPEIFYDEE